MKITFLGTGTSQGVPVIACDCPICLSEDPRDKRLRTSALIEYKGLSFVIDAGPDFRQQMLRENVHVLDAILITHEHKDHIGGMDDVRAYNFKTGRAIDIYSDDRVQRAIIREYPYVFTDKKYPGVPMMKLHSISETNFSLKDIEIIPIRVYHYRLPLFGFRFGDFAYITDANYISEESKDKLSGVKYLVINALRKEKHISHFALDEAIETITDISPSKAYITHIGHQMGFYEDISKELPKNIILAYDGLKISYD